MRHVFWLGFLLIGSATLAAAQETSVDELTPQELAVVQAIKAKNQTPQEAASDTSSAAVAAQAAPMQAPPSVAEKAAQSGDITLSEQAKQQAWEAQKQAEAAQTISTADTTADTLAAPTVASASTPADDTQAQVAAQQADLQPLDAADAMPVLPAQDPQEEAKALKKCLTVAFIDIDIAFNEHPRTQAVKQQIDIKIKAKEREVESAKDIIAALEAENKLLSRQLADLKPFYERIVTDQVLLPRVPESADTLELGNLLNRLTFAGSEVISTSPLNSPARLDDVTERIGANKKIIAERNFFIDNYKYQTREEILNLEKEEVKNILQDIYTEIKSFAKKRNIGAIVRKDEILYGQQPVNVTKDFVSTLKKSKKYRKKK